MPVKQYRKKPLTIEAIRFTDELDQDIIDEIIEFTNNQFYVVDVEDRVDDPDQVAAVFDVLHSTWVGVKRGDYIIKGVKGEFYPHDGDLWPEAYDEVLA